MKCRTALLKRLEASLQLGNTKVRIADFNLSERLCVIPKYQVGDTLHLIVTADLVRSKEGPCGTKDRCAESEAGSEQCILSKQSVDASPSCEDSREKSGRQAKQSGPIEPAPSSVMATP